MFPTSSTAPTPAPIVRPTITPSCVPVSNPYGAVCVANLDQTYNYKCTIDTYNCTNPTLWAIFVDTAEGQTFAWDSNERYFMVSMKGGATMWYDLIDDNI